MAKTTQLDTLLWTLPPTMVVTDLEDVTPTTIVIDTLPTTGTLYYNGIPVTQGQVITGFDPTLLTVDPDAGNVTVIFDYHTVDAAGVASDIATVTMPFTFVPPSAVDNSETGLVSGTATTIDILADDTQGTYALDPTTVQLVNTTTPTGAVLSPDGKTLTVPGEGVWTVLPTGEVTFTPDGSFLGDPTPITYTVQDVEGNTTNEATITLDYLPQAANDSDLGNSVGDIVVIDVLANDNTGDTVDPTTLQIAGTANPGDPLVVPGEGTWTINPVTGAITFTPELGFAGNPTVITYTVNDDDGNVSNPATVTVTYLPSSVGDTIFYDNNQNGVPENGEGLVGVTVSLTPSASVDLGNGPGVPITTVTDSNGNYLFENLPAGIFVVTVDESTLPVFAQGHNTIDLDGSNDSTDNVTLGLGEDNDTLDFGYFNPGSIGDTIWDDANNDGIVDAGEGLAGVDVTLTPSANIDLGAGLGVAITTTTDANGMYLFTDLPFGDYMVTVDTTDLPARLQVPGAATQDPDSGADSISTVSLGAGENILTQDFGYYIPVVISGNVGIDLDNNGTPDHDPLEPVTITLYAADGVTVVATTTTDAFGNYSFDVPAGNYVLEESDPTGTTSVSDIDGANDNRIGVDATNGDVPNNDFVDEPQLGTLEGTTFTEAGVSDGIFNGTDQVLPNIDITVTDGYGVVHTVTTDALGFYTVPNLPAGPVTVVVASDDPDIPEGAVVTVGTPATVTINVGATTVHDIGYDVPSSVNNIDPASIAVCASPSSITWEGATVSSISVWNDMSTAANFFTKDLATSTDSVAVTFSLDDSNGPYNYVDGSGTNAGIFTGPYLTTYLGTQANPSGTDGFQLTGGATPEFAVLTVTFATEVLLDNWRIRDIDSGDQRGVDIGWDWQDAVKMVGFDASNNPVDIVATLSGATNLILDVDGFYHTDIANIPAEAIGLGTDSTAFKGHVVYSSNGVPIQRLEITHKAGPDLTNQTRSALALSGFAVCTPIIISGTIYNDGDGNTGGVNGSTISTTDGDQLYAHLVDDSGNVIDVVAIAADGTYLFDSHIDINTDYTIVLSTVQTTAGNAIPAPVITTDWNNSSEIASSDAPLNGVIAISVVTSDVTGVDFGLNKKPIANDVSQATVANPGSNVQVTVPTLNVSDVEDVTPTTIVIDTLPTTGTLYYSGVPVTQGQVITGFNPTLLTVDPDAGNVTVVFDYHTVDAAGIESDVATVTMPFSYVPPVATNNSDTGLVSGTPTTLNVVGDDTQGTYALDPTTVQLVNTTTPTGAVLSPDGKTLTVPGEGVWTVLPTGEVTFTPEPGFTDDPTPVTYTVEDIEGNTSNEATITLDYLPQTVNDSDLDNDIGTTVVIDVLANDTNGDSVDPTTVQIVGTANPGDSLVVPGEGTWSINPVTGAITFTPEPGFAGDPTVITYTVKDDEGNTSNPATVTVTYIRGSIGDTIFNDIDNDGVADVGEGIAGVTVTLTPPATIDLGNGLGQPITTVTTGTGTYVFNNLPPGDYEVSVDESSLPPALAGNNTQDPDGTTDSTNIVTLGAGVDIDTIDFGYFNPGIIGDTVWFDGNNDGVVDAGEGLAGVTVTLTPPATIDLGNGLGQPVTTVTDSNGHYTFENLPEGDYTVTVDESTLPMVAQGNNTQDPDTGNDSTSQVTLTAGGSDVDQDFGYFVPATVSLAKTVYAGHDAGASCPGTDLVQALTGDNVTYCFVVTNTGQTYLDAVNITDAAISVTQVDLIVSSGSLPLAPSQSIVYYYQAVSNTDLVNTASVSTNPVDTNGADLPGGIDATDTDTAEIDIVTNGVNLDKSLYVGHDSGVGCPGTASLNIYGQTDVTYCFTVTNSSDTYLADINIVDAQIGVTQADLTLLSGTLPLAPASSAVYYYATTLSAALVNSAEVSANPVDATGTDIAGLPIVTAIDTATTTLLVPEMSLVKSVYKGHDSGAGCPGIDQVTLGAGTANVTFCFTVTNTGQVDLGDIAVNDITLGVNSSAMTLLSGTAPLIPGESMVWYYQSTLSSSINNKAQATANPIDVSGIDIPALSDESSDGAATVTIMVMIPTLNSWSLFILLMMMLAIGYRANRKHS